MGIKCSCGRDLTVEANSDGRAESLKNLVQYACEYCIPYRGSEAGQAIGDYRIVSKIGSGGMGDVYLVHHPATCRLLVLKKITKLYDENLIKRFQREVYLLQDLEHENLIRYIESSLDESQPYLVMVYASGGNLNDLLMEQGPLQFQIQ